MTQFKSPTPDKGDIVTWYPEGKRDDAHACPAFVQYSAGQTVGLIVYKGGARPMFYPYVRHVDDPFFKEGDQKARQESGGWDYSPMMKRLFALEDALKDLAKSRSSK